MSKKIATTLKHIRRSPYQSIAAVVMTTVTFFMITLFVLVTLGGSGLLTYFESRPQVTAFFEDQATRGDADKLLDRIKSQVEVESSSYVSKDDALAIYREQNKADPLLLEMVTADILPASLEISAKNVADLERVATVMEDDALVEEVVFQKDVIGVLETWINGARIAGIGLSGVLLIVSLVAIITILGMRFAMRKGEITTLSLLGATSWYIRSPFVIEGVLYASLGALLGWISAYIVLLYLSPNLVSFFQGIPLLPVSPWTMLAILGGELLLSIAIGSLASLVATRRYGR